MTADGATFFVPSLLEVIFKLCASGGETSARATPLVRNLEIHGRSESRQEAHPVTLHFSLTVSWISHAICSDQVGPKAGDVCCAVRMAPAVSDHR